MNEYASGVFTMEHDAIGHFSYSFPIVAGEGISSLPRRGANRFSEFDDSPLKTVAENPVSTFSLDVDTSSYSFIRASLRQGSLLDPNAVRTEELVNYFPYEYATPPKRELPFSTQLSIVPTPWNPGTQLLHVGIKGFELGRDATPRANLVFLIDTSGSMDAPNKLPLVIQSFKQLLTTLAPEDSVAIVTYAGSAGTALTPTKVSERTEILSVIENLSAGGSTAGAEGIRQAYLLAERSFVEDGLNRVILATDGDFNVGISDVGQLQRFVASKRESGVFLSVLGFGMGNLNDELMQALAQNGNGVAAYIDTLSEARKVLVDGATSMLFPIAKDVKVQVEFNPAAISEYRLIGYEQRILRREDFRNDKVDAGDVGAGHTVTAIYEITPKGSAAELVEALRYRRESQAAETEFAGELAHLKIRYKLPEADSSNLIATPIALGDAIPSLDRASDDVRFAVAVAAFGQILRGGRYTGSFDYPAVIALASGAKGEDLFGYRAEFVSLVRLAESIEPSPDMQRMVSP